MSKKVKKFSLMDYIVIMPLIVFFIIIPVMAENNYILEEEEKIIINKSHYIIEIIKDGFRYSFLDNKGEKIVDSHSRSGLRLTAPNGTSIYDAETTSLIDYSDDQVQLQVTMENGEKVNLYIYPRETYARFKIKPFIKDQNMVQNLDRSYVTNASQVSLNTLENNNWQDYIVKAEIKIDNREDSSGSGPIFRYQDEDNFYHFRTHGLGRVQLLKWINGSAKVIETIENVPIEKGTYEMKIKVKGEKIDCYLNGKKKIEAIDTSLVSGTAGIRVWNDKHSLNYLTVKNLEGEVLFEDDFEDGKDESWKEQKGSWQVVNTQKEKRQRTIDVRTSGLGPVYGLGDYGAHANDYIPGTPAQGKIDTRKEANLMGLVRNDMTNRGSNMRFISNFAIFPKHELGQVMFEMGEKRVSFTEDENRLGSSGVKEINSLYYFFGDMKQIYSDYKKVRNKEGYRDMKPKPEMFGVGWESYGALGWNTHQSSVIDTLKKFLERNYRLYWGVIGSGFWRGPRGSKNEGTTTSFGLWDNIHEQSRNDGFPNPRYPEVERLKTFFEDNEIDLILGLRNHFKAPRDQGGYYTPEYDGSYPIEFLNNNYYLEGKSGEPLLVKRAGFPDGNIYLLDSHNEEALDWFIEGVHEWDVQGFKEDAMIYIDTYHDDNWNKLNEHLMEDKYNVIVRNSAYSAPGDLLRINDTMYGDGSRFHSDPDRIPINLLSFAASGMSHLYPDIIGGTPGKISPTNSSYQKYYVRNAIFNALCPSMSLGTPPWELEDATYEKIVKKVADWHNRHVPYIYSAVLEWYETGYPHAMTPLHIAYPEDHKVHQLINIESRQYQWMLGPSMLATPVFGKDFATSDSRDVYLPAGKWIDYETGEIFKGPTMLENYSIPVDKLPIFIGGKGTVVTGNIDDDTFYATVYPIIKEGSKYTYNHINGKSVSTITSNNEGWNPKTMVIKDITAGKNIDFEYDSDIGSFKFELIPGYSYELTEGD